MIKDRHGNKLTPKQILKKIANRVYSYILDFSLMILHVTTWIPLHTLRNFIWRLSGMTIGPKSTLHTGVRVFNPMNIRIGKGTIIGYRSFLDGRRKIRIGDHTDIASEVMIYNEEHDIDDPEFKATGEEVIIGNYVFIGPRAIILPGVSVGDNAVIAAGAVVTKDVSKGEVVGGVPAKKIRNRKLKNPQYKLGRFKMFQ